MQTKTQKHSTEAIDVARALLGLRQAKGQIQVYQANKSGDGQAGESKVQTGRSATTGVKKLRKLGGTHETVWQRNN